MIIDFLKTIILCLSIVSRLDASRNPADDYPFHVIMAADTQYPWTEPHQLNLESEKRISKTLIENYFESMRKMSLKIDNLEAIFINGDLTAFGHDDELDTVQRLLEAPMSWTQVHLGLGNHDYANNVDNCFENHCSTRMVKYMLEHREVYNNMDMQVSRLEPANHEDWVIVLYKGSLAYSINIGNIHFVQLHNHPTYFNQWNSTNYFDDVTEVYQVTDSLDWLSRDLEQASTQNRSIIICMHDPTPRRPFLELMAKYKISAIFAGHFHSNIGLYDQDEAYGTIPLFGSGSAIYGTYLLVTFENPDNMLISAWSAKNGNVQPMFGENLDKKIRTDLMY